MTQGEEPAEAPDYSSIAKSVVGNEYRIAEALRASFNAGIRFKVALSSPKEGATAVGADKIVAELKIDAECVEKGFTAGTARLMRNAAALIESLQRQVIFENRQYGEEHGRRIAAEQRAEAAESSLRSLGDALERARKIIEDYAIVSGIRHPQTQDWNCQLCAATALDIKQLQHAPGCILALTPPKQDLSPQEEQRRSFVAGNVGLENPLVTRELVDEVANEPATPSSPSDKVVK